MSLSRYAKKRDAIEPFVIGVARKKGWKVIQHDKYDLELFRNGVRIMAEVKSGQKALTPRQQALIDDGWPLVVIRSVEEAEELLK